MPWLSLIPWRAVGILAILLGVFGYGYYGGIQHQQDKQIVIDGRRAQAEAEALQAAVNDALKRSHRSYQVAAKQLEAETKIRTITKTIVRTIRDEKPSADCNLSNGWVLRHNEAAAGSVPAAASLDHEAASGIGADQALEQVAGNYGQCLEIRSIAESCQEWIKAQIE